MRLEPIDLASAVVVGRGAARPEDVAIARDGTVWLSDERSACARVRADGSLERIGTAGGPPNGINLDPHGRIRIANGIALDYDERHLYVCETTGCDVLRYPIAADGTLGTPQRHGPTLGLPPPGIEQLRSMTPDARGQLGMTDGCGFDQAGNLWVTVVMKNTVVAITPDGDVVPMLSDPEGGTMRHPTNVTWGGADL